MNNSAAAEKHEHRRQPWLPGGLQILHQARQVVMNSWFHPGTRWEQVDMDRGTILDYPGLPAERILYWQKRAFREWAFRPRPMLTYLKMLLSDISTLKLAINAGLQHLSWSSSE